MVKPVLPPAYDLVVVGPRRDSFARALEFARTGSHDGLVVCADRIDRFEMALVLEPEDPLEKTLEVIPLFALAASDALGSLTAPALPLTLRWPDRLLFDGAELARLRFAWDHEGGAGDIPSWLVLGIEARMREPTEPGHLPDVISLEGAGMIEPGSAPAVEAVARHFLWWVDRWEHSGFEPVRREWNRRCERFGEHASLRIRDMCFEGEVQGLDNRARFWIGGRCLELMERPEVMR